MIKQGKNTIYCDMCKAEIEMKMGLIETKYLNKGIQINFYRCNKCGVKYLVGVTDHEVREKQQELRKWSDQHKKALDVNMDGMNEEELKKLIMLADETKFNMDKLTNEIKASMAELKEKYEGEL